MNIKLGTLIALKLGESYGILGFVIKTHEKTFDWWSFNSKIVCKDAIYSFYEYFEGGIVRRQSQVIDNEEYLWQIT